MKKEPNFSASQKLIRKVVRHNIISYSDDVENQAWSFGYYLNNCRYRLNEMQNLMDLGFKQAGLA